MEIITLEGLKNDPRASRLNLNIFKAEVGENDIEKGHLMDSVRYGKLGEFKVNKTGKEINELLAKSREDLNTKRAEIVGTRDSYKKLIDLECDDSYSKNGSSYERYSWSLISSLYPQDQSGARLYETVTSQDEVKKYDLCEQFNSLGYRLREVDEDLLTLDALSEVFEDNKSYDLEVRTLVSLMQKED